MDVPPGEVVDGAHGFRVVAAADELFAHDRDGNTEADPLTPLFRSGEVGRDDVAVARKQSRDQLVTRSDADHLRFEPLVAGEFLDQALFLVERHPGTRELSGHDALGKQYAKHPALVDPVEVTEGNRLRAAIPVPGRRAAAREQQQAREEPSHRRYGAFSLDPPRRNVLSKMMIPMTTSASGQLSNRKSIRLWNVEKALMSNTAPGISGHQCD